MSMALTEEGKPHIPSHDHRRYTFTARPAGTRWYHSHGHAGRNLNKFTYSGELGLYIVEPKDDAGRYDLEVPLILHEWDPYFTEHGCRLQAVFHQRQDARMR
jgi:FtsP/CotA-like multicopper oxidase with cupredoxin domain